MSKVKIQGNASGTGVVTLTAPNTNTDRTITLPDDTQTLIGTNASGNVGIGTTSPSTKLSVTGGYISQVNAGVSTYLGEDGSGGSLVGTTSNHYFRFITNNTERMRIDSAGRVTMPNQPHAQFGMVPANTSGSYVVGSYNSSPIPFDNAYINVGNHYSTSTYRFTCPVDGVYSAGFHTLTSSNSDITYAKISKNGVVMHKAYNIYRGFQVHANIKCNAGDYLTFHLDSDTLSMYEGNPHTAGYATLIG